MMHNELKLNFSIFFIIRFYFYFFAFSDG